MDLSVKNRLWNWTVICSLLGAFLSSWLAPKFIAWYFDPPVDIGVNCRAATEWSMHGLQNAQIAGLIIGAVVGITAAYYWNRRNASGSRASPEKPIK